MLLEDSKRIEREIAAREEAERLRKLENPDSEKIETPVQKQNTERKKRGRGRPKKRGK